MSPGLQGRKQQTPLQTQIQTAKKETAPKAPPGANPTQYLSFDDQKILEPRARPDENLIGGQARKSHDFFTWEDAFEDGPHGWLQSLLKPIIDGSFKATVQFEDTPDSYQNNFQINYHSHHSPLPIPIQGFVTGLNITKTTEAPYESCAMTLRIPFNFATALLAGEDGHPSTGGWILIRQKTIPNADTVELSEAAGFEIDPRFEKLADSPSLFLGTVSEIDWNIFSDQNGNFMCDVTIVVSSFIHNLMYGQFRSTAIVGEDQKAKDEKRSYTTTEFDGSSPQINSVVSGKPLPTIATYSSNEFMFNGKEWTDFITEQVMMMQGKLKNEKGQWENDPDGGLTMTGSLRNMLSFMGYPVLPLSFYAEPLDIETFYQTFLDDVLSGQRVYGQGNFAGLAIPEQVLIPLVTGAIYLLEAAVQENDIYTSNVFESSQDLSRRTQFSDTVQGNTGRDVVKQGVLETTTNLKELRERFIETFRQSNLSAYTGMRLGDIIHVASSRDDVPLESNLYPAMPKINIKDASITHIKNLSAKNGTIWGLLKGTFQPDEELIEFYPTMIPLTGWSSRAESTQIATQNAEQLSQDSNGFIYSSMGWRNSTRHPLWQAIGGIPAIVFRYKPLHPQIKGQITADRINSINAFHSKLNRTAILKEPMQYQTITEKYNELFSYVDSDGETKSFFDDNSYYERTVIYTDIRTSTLLDSEGKIIEEAFKTLRNYRENQTAALNSSDLSFIEEDSYSEDVYRPVLIRKEQIMSMSFRQDDTLRVNATFTQDPALRNVSGLIKYALTPSTILNTQSAMRHGLRMYESVYPFFDLQTYNSDSFESLAVKVDELIKKGNSVSDALKIAGQEGLNNYPNYALLATGASERAYMLYGDEQKYFRGTVSVKAAAQQNLMQGTWIEFDLGLPNSARENLSNLHERFMLAYVIGLSYSYEIDQETGLVELVTNISFERGSLGAVIPNFPTRKDFDFEDFRQRNLAEYLQNEAIPNATGIRYNPLHSELKPVVIPKGDETDTTKSMVLIRDPIVIQYAYDNNMITEEQFNQYLTEDQDGIPAGWPTGNPDVINDAYIGSLPDDKKSQIKPQLQEQ